MASTANIEEVMKFYNQGDKTLETYFNYCQDKHNLGLKTSIQNFDAFVRCTLMENQPWPRFQNGIGERSITRSKVFITNF